MLTISQGLLKGKKIALPDRAVVRPMGQRMKEAVFNILAHRFAVNWSESEILDSFAGSGSLGLEALSRGARHVCFAEIRLENINNIKKVAKPLLEKTSYLSVDATSPYTLPWKAKVGFVDPPFGKGMLEKGVACCASNLHNNGVIVVQKETKEELVLPEGWQIAADRIYTYKHVCFLTKVCP